MMFLEKKKPKIEKNHMVQVSSKKNINQCSDFSCHILLIVKFGWRTYGDLVDKENKQTTFLIDRFYKTQC
jgi:hypothetical protein